MKVLIVEDEARLGRMLKQSLSEHAHIVNWVSTCAAANDAIVETSYDLIVVDLGLPDGDGIALVRDWRECGFTEPILILSARDSREDRVRGLDVGADDYFRNRLAWTNCWRECALCCVGRLLESRPSMSITGLHSIFSLMSSKSVISSSTSPPVSMRS